MTIRSFIEKLLAIVDYLDKPFSTDRFNDLHCLDCSNNMTIDCMTGDFSCKHCNLAGTAFDLYGRLLKLNQIEQTYCAPAVMYRLSHAILDPKQLEDGINTTLSKIEKMPVKNQALLADARKRLNRDKFFKLELSCLPDDKYRDIVVAGEIRLRTTTKLFIMPSIVDGELSDMIAIEPVTNTYLVWEV